MLVAERSGLLDVLNSVESGLCFGRIDFADGTRYHIGRIGIRENNEERRPLVIDGGLGPPGPSTWPVAIPHGPAPGGGTSPPPHALGKAVRQVIADPSYRKAAQEVARENGTRPAPSAVVAQIARLT